MSDFGLDLILAEEARREETTDDGPAGENTFVYEEKDVTRSGSFYLTPEETGMSVPGPGTVDSFLAVADTDDFQVTIETGTTMLLDDDLATLKANSAELSHVAAYQRNDDAKEVLSVSEFEYRDRVSTFITTGASPVTFDRLRAVYTLDEGVAIE